MFCPLYVRNDASKHCDVTDKWNAVSGINRLDSCPLKSIEGLIEEIEHITPKATVRYGKLSIDSCLMIPVDKVIEIIKEYCEVSNDADSN